MVTTYTTCCKQKRNHAEPMMPTTLPERPWHKIGVDLFHHGGKENVIADDYYSRFFEIAPPPKSFFSPHGIPEITISENGPQFLAATFSKFAEEWGFTHLTTSAHYPQSNGEAERAVQTTKDLITKSEDPYLALLSYRTTPLDNGYTPAQLLMGSKLRSTLPLAPEKLTPKWPETEQLRKTELEYKHKQAEKYNRRHRASVLPS